MPDVVAIHGLRLQLDPEYRNELAVAAARREAAAGGSAWARPSLATRLYYSWWRLLGPGSRR